MSEKEINETDLVGKKIEDLTEEELNSIQGQGQNDVGGEVIFTVTTVTVTTVLFTTKKK